MDGDTKHYRHVMRFLYREGPNAAEAARRICAVYGPNVAPERTVRFWFARFRNGVFDVEDLPRSGRPREIDTGQVTALVDANQHLTLRKAAGSLRRSHTAVKFHLDCAGYVSRANLWEPHDLTDRSRRNRVDVCKMLLEKNRKEPFLRTLITGDEKWVVYNNVAKKRSWVKKGSKPQSVPKPGPHPKKVMLSAWWDHKGIVYYELLPNNETINSAKYCEQLDRLQAAIDRKRPELSNRRGVTFQHDNARPHTSLATRKKLPEFAWDVLPHPPYSPDLAPSDYHLFRSLQNSLIGKKFESLEQVKIHLEQFFQGKPREFWAKGVYGLPDRWKEVIQKRGAYIIP